MAPLAGRGGTLAILLIASAPAVGVTSLAARLYHARERTLTAQWTARGDADLAASRPLDAVGDYRNALTFAREDRSLRLRLARSLIAANRPAEARAQLLALRDAAPASGVVNLALARLAAGAGDVAQASAFYHEAIAGVWDDRPAQQRRDARLEFATMLLAHHDTTSAQAQLIALVAELPPDSDLQNRVGRLLLDAGAPDRALQLFRARLLRDPRDAEALSGAGESAFATADYAAARRYLTAATRHRALDQGARDALDTASAVLDLNPFERRLSSSERTQRAFLAFRHARTRLAECAQSAGVRLDAPGSTDRLAELNASADRLEPAVRRPAFARDSDLLETVMTIVFRIETAAAERCGPPAGTDRALLLLASAGR